MMKKNVFLCLLCTLAMSAALAGCGSQTEDVTSTPEQTTTTAPATETESTTTTEKATTKAAATTQVTAATEETETTEATETTETTDTTESSAATETEAPTTEEATEAPTEPSEDAQPTEPPTTEPTQPPASFTEADLVFTAGGNSLTVGQDAAGFVAAVPADSVESAPSCYGNGNDVNYYYTDYTLYIWDSNGTQLTYGIDITGGSLTTSKGIGIGASLADVENAYGTGYTVEGPDYVYTSGNSNLRFTISGDKVVYISYNYNL